MPGIIVEQSQHTKYEKTRIIGARALQLSMGAPILIKLSEEDLEALNYDVLKIACKEYEADVIPMLIERTMPHLKETKEQAKIEKTE